MPNLKDIKRRMHSVQSTMQITKAMELVASSKLRKAKDRAEAAQPFFEATYKLMSEIAAEDPYFNSQFVRKRTETGACLLIVIAGDRGLAGGFNSNVLKIAQARINEIKTQGGNPIVMPVGQKAVDYFENRDVKILKSYDHIAEHMNIYLAMDMAELILNTYKRHESLQTVEIVFTNYVSPILQVAQKMEVIPLDEMAGSHPRRCAVEYEPSPEEVFDKLVPRYVASLIYGAIVESFASEQAARRTAMENATDNATEMIDNLSLLYNRARQGAITQELTEIVSGANAQQ
ncbi:MAG: ATP synthase F1 subunit gamma [Oscillospiraceae bacterium]|nr:ATP synthase F1 subunit gamma [Oscillospiraceae bacterium]MBR7083884.1 ATP synthase F1 subunit gamma [Oscillospiraceae bacterium]